MGQVASDINPVSVLAKAISSMCHDCTKFVLNSCDSECNCCSCWQFGFHTHKVSSSSSDSDELPPCCFEWYRIMRNKKHSRKTLTCFFIPTQFLGILFYFLKSQKSINTWLMKHSVSDFDCSRKTMNSTLISETISWNLFCTSSNPKSMLIRD